MISNSLEKNMKISDTLKQKCEWLIIVFGVIGGIYGLRSYIIRVVEDRIKEPEFVLRVAEEIKKPTAIFDQDGSILVDDGAMNYIKSIKVYIGDANEPERIVISPHQHLQVAPLLESLDVDFYIEVKRGDKFDWMYTLRTIKRLALMGSADPPDQKRFRVEVFR
jgi:hypothetical protein